MSTRELPGYRAEARIGAGAITEAFRAKSSGAEGFERDVVLKWVHEHLAAIDGFVEAFVDRTRLAIDLAHTNVVEILDVGRAGDAGDWYVACEIVDGVSLAEILADAKLGGAPLAGDVARHVVSEIALGLDHAHRRRGLPIVHGGLSPSEVLVSREGRVRVGDFGAHLALSHARIAPHGVRTLPYRAPEVLAGEAPGAPSDLFSLGAIAFELAAGEPLFLGSTPGETRDRIEARSVPEGLADASTTDLVERLVAPPDARPSARAVHEELARSSPSTRAAVVALAELADRTLARRGDRPDAPSDC